MSFAGVWFQRGSCHWQHCEFFYHRNSRGKIVGGLLLTENWNLKNMCNPFIVRLGKS